MKMIDRLISKIEKIPGSGCWIYMGCCSKKGYGLIGRGGRGTGYEQAHRASYRHFKGEIPEGMLVCHRCDVPACCNPDHLFLGTAKDNAHDRDTKGRFVPLNGERNGRHKLSANDVITIRQEQKVVKRSPNYWAKQYGVTEGAIRQLLNGATWKYLAL